ncbi:uncharacterized protein LOC124251849 isoform X2 [Equus quagga]|uniref:uncharacterized protein LOC124251849 isoform X2 n=1 Tax=Equus quagga TaxID=89248 RepID=UPI001EE2A80C|nr:uncharacterized protein LOC124251849 isoform X2 [Equus quagga]
MASLLFPARLRGSNPCQPGVCSWWCDGGDSGRRRRLRKVEATLPQAARPGHSAASSRVVASALRLPRWPWLPPACGAASLSGVPSPPTQVHHGQAGWVGLMELGHASQLETCCWHPEGEARDAYQLPPRPRKPHSTEAPAPVLSRDSPRTVLAPSHVASSSTARRCPSLSSVCRASYAAAVPRLAVTRKLLRMSCRCFLWTWCLFPLRGN